jgi:hypothetical protein
VKNPKQQPQDELGQILDKAAKEATSTENEEMERILLESSMSFDDEPPKETVCFRIQDSEVGTLGNISAIIGKAKSRKTFLISSFVASALAGECLGIESENLKGKRILWIDTEQGKTHVHKVLTRAVTMAGLKEHPTNLNVLHLRKYTPKERVSIIGYAISKFQNIGLVVIDGIRDLISDINNADESNDCIGKLMKWSEEKNLHILTVLHQNKGNDFARGHLGSELVNKAESVISVEKQDELVSTVKSDFTRDIDFQEFAFDIDANGIPHLDDNYNFSSGRNSTHRGIKLTFDSFTKEEHRSIILGTFNDSETMKYGKCWTALKSNINHKFKDRGSISDNNAKEYLKKSQESKYIGKEESKNGSVYTSTCLVV